MFDKAMPKTKGVQYKMSDVEDAKRTARQITKNMRTFRSVLESKFTSSKVIDRAYNKKKGEEIDHLKSGLVYHSREERDIWWKVFIEEVERLKESLDFEEAKSFSQQERKRFK